METPKKKKHDSIKELIQGGIILLLCSPCILSVFFGTLDFVLTFFFNRNPLDSERPIPMLIVALLVMTILGGLVIIRVFRIVRRIIGIVLEQRRLAAAIQDDENA
jgi:hypothetical protein